MPPRSPSPLRAMGVAVLLGLLIPWVPAQVEEAHAAAYQRCAPAVVGLTCDGPFRGGIGSFFGTGVVLSADGLVLTDTTVVPDGSRNIQVYFIDGRVLPARLIRVVERVEGALLQVDAENLEHLRLADSERAPLGAPVYSWGNPLHTIQRDGVVALSVGVLSGRYRVASVDDQSRYVGPVLETDAAINPGSDGGPLTDANGHLLGIVSLAFSPRRWLGLAIPSNELRRAFPELRRMPIHDPPVPSELAEHAPLAAALSERIEALAPAVVGIQLLRRGERPWPNRQARPLRRDLVYERAQHAEAERRRPIDEIALWSGFIVDASGVLITSAVALGEDPEAIERARVFLADGSGRDAELLGWDTAADVALLRIEARADERFPAVALADGEHFVGQGVGVLGRSEHADEVTCTIGHISALQRNDGNDLQISALVNYGNIGGPVFDLDGRVVGMAHHLREDSHWRQNCGVAFSMRVARMRQAIELLPRGETLPLRRRASLGVQLDADVEAGGARLLGLKPSGAAAAAGLQTGDVILRFGQQRIGHWVDLLRAVRAADAGEKVRILVRREQTLLVRIVELGERER